MKRKKGIKAGISYQTDIQGLQLDFMALLLDEAGKLVSNLHFIFYNNPKSPDGSVEHLGNILIDSRDLEEIITDTDKADQLVKRVLFFANIHKAELNSHNLSMVKKLRLNFADLSAGNDIAEFVPDKDNYYDKSNLIVLAELADNGGSWQLAAHGDCYRITLEEFTDLLSSGYSYEKFKKEYYKNYKYLGGDFSSVRTIIEREREENYYRLLECKRESTDEEIKRKYKELVKAFHPDIIGTKGLHKDIVEFAAKRFGQIKEAYEFIKTKRERLQ